MDKFDDLILADSLSGVISIPIQRVRADINQPLTLILRACRQDIFGLIYVDLPNFILISFSRNKGGAMINYIDATNRLPYIFHMKRMTSLLPARPRAIGVPSPFIYSSTP